MSTLKLLFPLNLEFYILISTTNCIYHYTTKHQNNSTFLWRSVLLKVLSFSLYHFIITTTLKS